MRKLMMMIVAILAMTACTKEDKGIAQKDIVGKWNVTEVWSVDGNKWENASAQGISAEFNKDNNYSASMIGSGTYTIDGNTVIGKSGSKTYKFVFELDGNKATITINEGEKMLYKVKATRS